MTRGWEGWFKYGYFKETRCRARTLTFKLWLFTSTPFLAGSWVLAPTNKVPKYHLLDRGPPNCSILIQHGQPYDNLASPFGTNFDVFQHSYPPYLISQRTFNHNTYFRLYLFLIVVLLPWVHFVKALQPF